MTLSTILVTSVMALILIIALYAWAFVSLASKWRFLTPFGAFLYIALAVLCPGAGPVPILILLHLNVGVHSDHV